MARTVNTIAAVELEGLLEKLPGDILNYIYTKFEPETLTTLCSVACVSRRLHSSVKGALSFSSFDFSAFSFYPKTFPSNVWKIKKITFDCLHLDDSSIKPFLGSHIEALVLLKCSKLSYGLLSYIEKTCPNLRVLTLEISALFGNPKIFDSNLKCLLKSCPCLESLCIKVREYNFYENEVMVNFYENEFMVRGIYNLLSKTIKVLKLEPTRASESIVLLRSLSASVAPKPFVKTLTQISLVVDNITNALLHSISHTLPLLAKLDLKDRPISEPLATHDLTDLGIKSLVDCKHLSSLSLRRSQKYIETWFGFVTDTGMFHIAEGCKQLEYVRLGGFSNITNVGYRKLLTSCLNLKKIVFSDSDNLSCLAFRDLSKVRKTLEKVKLEVLDLHDCFSVEDSCLRNISRLTSLTSLNLSGTYVTDAGMAVLGKGNTPISRLSLRGCDGVTDKGIALLLASEGRIVKTLSSLDLSDMSKITDNAITTIVDYCVGLTELCIRLCKYITDASVIALALRGTLVAESKLLRRLDLYRCVSLSVGLPELLENPLFHGLQWIGVGGTTMDAAQFCRFAEICERQSLTICNIGCEMGCHNHWMCHLD